MRTQTSEEPIRYILHRSEEGRDNFLEIQPPFQREFSRWKIKKRSRLIETILEGHHMNPIWTIFNPVNSRQEVLDGMHRLLHIKGFVQNEFYINYKGEKKCFRELSEEERNKFLNYNICFNHLDSSFSDPKKLQDQYEILNNCSTKLNRFELQKPTLHPFYNFISHFIQNNREDTNMFIQPNHHRGQNEREVIKCLVLSEHNIFDIYDKSIEELIDDWIEHNISFVPSKIEKNLFLKKSQFEERLKKIIIELPKSLDVGRWECYHSKNHLVWKYILCRLVGENKTNWNIQFRNKLKQIFLVLSDTELEQKVGTKISKKNFTIKLFQYIYQEIKKF